MKKILFSVLVIFTNLSILKAQSNFGKEWVIGGSGYMIKFDNPIKHDTSFKTFEFYYGSSNICDSNGDIVLLSNGMNLYNRNGNYIDGGDTLATPGYYNFSQGSPAYSQYSIILPVEDKKYYLVTATMNDTMLDNSFGVHPWKAPFNLLLYNRIDMNQNSGAGKVVRRMVPLIENKELIKVCMQACRHANGKDWWLLKQAGDSIHGNRVFKFLFTQDSVYNMGEQTIPYQFRGYFDLFGQMQFSPDGTKWASTRSDLFPSSGVVYMADFDRCTGMLSNFSKFDVPGYPTGFSPGAQQSDTTNVGLCFSPNGQNLYIGRCTHVVQYHIPTHSFYKVCGMDTTEMEFAGYTSLHTGFDGKIYIANFGGTSKQMNVIENPNGIGAVCNFCRKCLRSKSPEYYGYFISPPNMPNYELGASAQPCWPLSSGDMEWSGNQLEVYPNPVGEKLHIKHCEWQTKELFNTIGQLILSTKENELNVSKLNRGIYYLRCNNQVKKVVLE